MRYFRIAFVIDDLNIGGVEKIMMTYANKLDELGYDIFFITCRNGKFDNLLNSSIRHIVLDIDRFRYCMFKLANVLKKNCIDIVFCSNIQTAYVLGAKLISYSNFSIVSSHHFYCNNSETKWYYKFGLKTIYNRCNKVIAVSDGVKEELIKTLGVSSNKVTVLKNPIDINHILKLGNSNIPSIKKEKYIVWVGRFSVVKNIHRLILSFKDFKKNNPDWGLVLVGDGNHKGEIELFVKDNNVPNVYFTGALANPYPYIKKSSIVALSSDSEAYPTVLLEALSFGKTIVSTPTKGAIEILHNGQLGYIAKDFSCAEFTRQLLYAKNNPLEASLLVQEVSNSDTMIVTRRLIQIFNEI